MIYYPFLMTCPYEDNDVKINLTFGHKKTDEDTGRRIGREIKKA